MVWSIGYYPLHSSSLSSSLHFPLIFFPSLTQFAGGFLTFFWPGLSLPLRKAFLPYHQLVGLLIFLGSTGTALLGISEYAAWHHR
jgi:hypothetical protein